MFNTPMFSTLESTWDQSTRRGWTTLASITIQAFGLSLLLLIPLLTVQGPPMLRWLDMAQILTPPPAPAPQTPGPQHPRPSNIGGGQLLQPAAIPSTVAILNEPQVASSPDVGDLGVLGGTGTRGRGVIGSVGTAVEVAPPPPPPAPTHPLRVSHWAEGNLIYRVPPIYPRLAQQARIEGTVELRAIVSRAGTIENLVVVRGHPMLVAAAVDAVRQWRYRPYLLNSEPVAVETEITVKFVLSGE
jgi:periplasmic protein TonB